MSWLRHAAAATILMGTLGAASGANAGVFIEHGDGSVRISFGMLLPAVQEHIFHVELELLEELDPPYGITFAATAGSIVPFTAVPEPTSFMLLGAALIALGLVLRRPSA